MLFRYVAFHYLKNMLIILLGLTGLFAGLDFLMNANSLSSFNVKILYSFSRWEEAVNLLYPLAIILGAIWTKISFIKSNTIGSFYALGISRKRLFIPFFVVAFGIYLLMVMLNFTTFAKGKDRADMLKKNQYAMSPTKDLFFKYNDSFVFIDELIPQMYKIEGLTLFKLRNNRMVAMFEAKEAWYNIEEWIATDVIRKTIVDDSQGNKSLKIEKIGILHTLKEYQPEILKFIYDGQQLTIDEIYKAKILLENQGLKTESLRADMYSRIVTPLFSIALVMILFFSFPFHARYMNMGLFGMQTIGATLFVWGVLFAFHRIGMSGAINPELISISPIVLLWIYAFYTLVQADKRI